MNAEASKLYFDEIAEAMCRARDRTPATVADVVMSVSMIFGIVCQGDPMKAEIIKEEFGKTLDLVIEEMSWKESLTATKQ